jgi:hypothetical protein
MTSSTTPDGGAGTGAAVEVVLRAAEGVHRPGRPVAVRIEVRNVTDSDLWMVGVLDGSEEGVRYPHYRPAVMRDGDTVAAPGPAEDPLVARLRVEDFRRLAPGESFDPTAPEAGADYGALSTFTTWACPEPGEYQYVLALSTSSEDPGQWLGRVGPAGDGETLRDLIARVPRLNVTSNVLTVRISDGAPRSGG